MAGSMIITDFPTRAGRSSRSLSITRSLSCRLVPCKTNERIRDERGTEPRNRWESSEWGPGSAQSDLRERRRRTNSLSNRTDSSEDRRDRDHKGSGWKQTRSSERTPRLKGMDSKGKRRDSSGHRGSCCFSLYYDSNLSHWRSER